MGPMGRVRTCFEKWNSKRRETKFRVLFSNTKRSKGAVDSKF